MRKIDSERLSQTFRQFEGRYHLTITAVYKPFKEFKVRWTPNPCAKSINFEVSDYMSRIPDKALRDFAGHILEKSVRKVSKPYPESVMKAMESKEFFEFMQPLYISRSRNLTGSAAGKAYDLMESAKRVVEQGLISPETLEGTVLSWTKTPNIRRVGYVSMVSRTIAISSIMDNEDVPEFVMDFVVYHELLHLEVGLKASRSNPHDKDFEELEARFPQHQKAEQILGQIYAKNRR